LFSLIFPPDRLPSDVRGVGTRCRPESPSVCSERTGMEFTTTREDETYLNSRRETAPYQNIERSRTIFLLPALQHTDMRLLLVEDDEVLADGLVHSLDQVGYAVDRVATGERAELALKQAPYNLLILDVGLPGMDGFEVLRRLRRRDPKLPVLILTARDAVEDRVRGLDLGADFGDRLRLAQAATARVAHLANRLLSLAHAESRERDDLSQVPVDLKLIAQNAAHDWVARALQKNVDLGFDLNSAWVRGDPVLLKELMSNLVDNAISCTPVDGSVTVRCYREGRSAQLEVEDNGIGIPETARDKVLERFYRVAGTPGEGSGLGLAIVAEIAQLHEVYVEITAPASGRGTLVRVTFPASGDNPCPKAYALGDQVSV
jgi:signal transduction histidine kinase